MRIPLCILVMAASAWAADTPALQPDASQPADAPEQAQTTPAPADAGKPADPPPAPVKLGGWVIGGILDGYVTDNFNHPKGNSNQLQNFDINYGQPEMSLGKISIDKSDKTLGVHLDLGFGETMRVIHAGDVAAQEHKGLRYVEQMYVIVKPAKLNGTEFDYGQFVTAAGAEVIEASSNWNYSRSLLFAWAIPYYHFGFRMSTPITKSFTAGVQIVNAWNTVWGNNNMNNIGITGVLTKPKYTWSTNYYEGANHLGTTSGKRNLFDTTLLLTPSSMVNAYINYDYGRDNRVGGGSDSWTGLAGAVHVQVSKKIAFTPRAEYFHDGTGFATGLKQELKELTITSEYKHNDHFLGRVEYRHDYSNNPFFDRGGQPGSQKNMGTLTLSLMAVLGPWK